jgi:hypothetical protein
MSTVTSFSGIGFGSYAVHGCRQSRMGLLRDGSKAHGTCKITGETFSKCVIKHGNLPVTNRLTISEAGSTSSMLTGWLDAMISSWPLKVHWRKLFMVDCWKRLKASRLLFFAASW